MLVAELRRKLPDVKDIDPKAGDPVAQVRALLKEASEDVLTSDVFGSLKYLPRRPYLESVLQLLAERNPRALTFHRYLPLLLAELGVMEFLFWPSYPTPGGFTEGGTTEPDVVLRTAGAFLVVEAKLSSGFGNQQVERELAVALDQSASRQAFLLLVTTSLSIPYFGSRDKRRTFEQYLDARIAGGHLAPDLGERLKRGVDRVLWVDWAGILAALKAARGLTSTSVDTTHALRATDLVDDLLTIAEMRGIKLFEGVTVLSDQPHGDGRPVLVSPAVSIAANRSGGQGVDGCGTFGWHDLAMRHDWTRAVRLLLRRS